jgi:small subunit ribosomal protein S3Ae
MAVGKNKRISKGGKRGSKKKIQEPMTRKEWYDVVAPAGFENRQFAKTICNKTQGLKIAADNLRGRVYEVNHADLAGGAATKDQPFRNVKFEVQEVTGRNLLTQFHSLALTTDKLRSLVRKWCTLIEAPIEAKTADGYVFRLFVIAFTRKARNQLSKNCYSKTRLEKWTRQRMAKIAQARLSTLTINEATKIILNDVLVDELSKKCNAILPLRDVKFAKVKVIRTPKFEAVKLYEAHGEIPESKEADAREVQEAEEPEAPAKDDKKEDKKE